MPRVQKVRILQAIGRDIRIDNRHIPEPLDTQILKETIDTYKKAIPRISFIEPGGLID